MQAVCGWIETDVERNLVIIQQISNFFLICRPRIRTTRFSSSYTPSVLFLHFCIGAKNAPRFFAGAEKIPAVPPQFTAPSRMRPHGLQTYPCAITCANRPDLLTSRRLPWQLQGAFPPTAAPASTDRGLSLPAAFCVLLPLQGYCSPLYPTTLELSMFFR